MSTTERDLNCDSAALSGRFRGTSIAESIRRQPIGVTAVRSQLRRASVLLLFTASLAVLWPADAFAQRGGSGSGGRSAPAGGRAAPAPAPAGGGAPRTAAVGRTVTGTAVPRGPYSTAPYHYATAAGIRTTRTAITIRTIPTIRTTARITRTTRPASASASATGIHTTAAAAGTGRSASGSGSDSRATGTTTPGLATRTARTDIRTPTAGTLTATRRTCASRRSRLTRTCT